QLLILANAPQMSSGAQEDLAVGNRQRGIRRFALAKAVGGEQFVLGTGSENESAGIPVHDVEFAVGVDHGAPVASAGPFFDVPDLLTRRQFIAARDAVVLQDIPVVVDDDAGADALVVA